MSVRTRIITFLAAVASLIVLLYIWIEYGGGDGKVIVLAGITACIGILIYLAILPARDPEEISFPYSHSQPPRHTPFHLNDTPSKK